VTLDRGRSIDDGQLMPVGGHVHVAARRNRDLGEGRASRLPAFAAAANVIVGGVAGHRHFDAVAGAIAIELAAGEAWRALADAIIHGRVNRYAHLLHPPTLFVEY
jgi:hypothetical protein